VAGSQNDDFLLLAFFSLGHRFVPHQQKPHNKRFHEEIEETKRKLAWKIFFEHKPANNKLKYVHYKKG